MRTPLLNPTTFTPLLTEWAVLNPTRIKQNDDGSFRVILDASGSVYISFNPAPYHRMGASIATTDLTEHYLAIIQLGVQQAIAASPDHVCRMELDRDRRWHASVCNVATGGYSAAADEFPSIALLKAWVDRLRAERGGE